MTEFNHALLAPAQTSPTLRKNSSYEDLRDRIVRVDLAPGTQLHEQALAKELGCGVASIREAVRRLAFEQLVQVVPRSGTFVAPIGLRESRSLMELRVDLEQLAVGLAAQRGSASERARLVELAEEQYAADDLQRCIDIDAEFHRLVYSMTRNQYLEAGANIHFNLALRFWYFCFQVVDTPQWGDVDHRPTAAAVLSGDPAAAQAAMEHHVRHDSQQVVDILTRHGL